MNLVTPLTFQPFLMERLWGGRQMETILNISLPPTGTIGELWAIVDRPEAQSIVKEGPFQGKNIHELWMEYRTSIFGSSRATDSSPRFPLLCKILDATETLSVQVHPPETQAALLGGESKTECWYLLHTQPGAILYAGLRRGVTQEVFRKALKTGNIESLLHTLSVKNDDSMFIPSGRLHAIGKGILLVEIQQNSDTTYRVFDWNRHDSQGHLRPLHIEESMASINFGDYEPTLNDKESGIIANSPYFRVEKWILDAPRLAIEPNDFGIFTCLTGSITCAHQTYRPGDFFLVPASMATVQLLPCERGTTVLRTRLQNYSANRPKVSLS